VALGGTVPRGYLVKGKKPDTCTRSVDPRAGSLHSPLHYHRALRGRDSATPKLLPGNRSVSIPAREFPSCPRIAFDLFKSSRPRSSTFAGSPRVNRNVRVLLRPSSVEPPPGRRSRVPIPAFVSRGRNRHGILRPRRSVWRGYS